jgi:hypothetical protein
MDFRMNERGITLDKASARAAIKLCEREVERLNAEMTEILHAARSRAARSASRSASGRTSNNCRCRLRGSALPDTSADTLSFMLYGVPTKAGEEAKAAAKARTDAKWESWGDLGKPLRRAMEICLEVNRSSVAKYKQMINSVCPDGRLHDIMLYNGADAPAVGPARACSRTTSCAATWRTWASRRSLIRNIPSMASGRPYGMIL